MGNYHSSSKDKRLIGECLFTAVSDFAEDLMKAAEIEFIDLKELQEENLPLIFFAVNLSIDRALKTMKEKVPDRVPPMKEYKKRVEEKKE